MSKIGYGNLTEELKNISSNLNNKISYIDNGYYRSFDTWTNKYNENIDSHYITSDNPEITLF